MNNRQIELIDGEVNILFLTYYIPLDFIEGQGSRDTLSMDCGVGVK